MYKSWIYIDTPVWNNEFSYQERIALWSTAKIFVTNLIQWTISDLEVGSEIVFEEVNAGKLVSCKGLKHFVHTTHNGITTYIFDNHNHALFFRYRHTQKLLTSFGWKEKESANADGRFKPFKVIHIDQHADTKPNINSFNGQHTSPHEVLSFTNYGCNVGNFLTSAKDAWIIEEVIQIRSQHALHTMEKLDFQEYNYIIDIDVDFWESKSEEEIESDFETIRTLFNNACLITIATSPYFFDQKKAIELIQKLL
jgi:hypothetical protein